VVGGSGSILHTTDGGITWTQKLAGRFPQNTFYNVSFADRYHGIIVGGNGLIITTSDGGENWTEQEAITRNVLQGVCFVDSAFATVVGYNGTFLHFSNDNPNFIKSELPEKRSFLIAQNYPNPFNPGTVIEYKLSHPGFTRVIIYNGLGQEITTLIKEYQSSDVHKAIFNGNLFPSGIYFCRIEQGNLSKVLKMSLIR
jgi:hypothetical protein